MASRAAKIARRAPDAELPRAGERGEVRDGRAGRGLVEAPRERRDDEDADRDADRLREEAGALDAVLGGAAARERDHEEDQHGPDEVELLLDRQRPVVAERRDGAVGREVVRAGAREVPVGDEEGRPDRVPQAGLGAHHVEDEERDRRRDHEHEQRGRHDAAAAALVEVEERDRLGALVLLEQQARDEEAADDEEDVDAHEAAGGPVEEVVDDDGHHREGAQALDVRAEAAVHRRRIPLRWWVLVVRRGAELRRIRERGRAPAKCLRAHGPGPYSLVYRRAALLSERP